MKYLTILLLFLSHTFADPYRVLQPKGAPTPLKTSVIVPCAGQHFEFLEPLLQSYRAQTLPPDEVVISLSSIEHLDPAKIDALEQAPWPFALKICRSRNKQSAGLNRNIAVSNSTGELILCQDADDLPHPQRVEIAKYIFENYNVEHLIHQYVPENGAFMPYNPSTVSVYSFPKFDDIEHPIFQERLHKGNVCLLRRVTTLVKWDDVKHLGCDHDIQFDRDVYQKFKNTAVIPCDLIMYRVRLSAFRSNDSWPPP